MKIRRWLCLLLCVAVLGLTASAQGISAGDTVEELARLLGSTPEKLLAADTLSAGDSRSDWAALVAARNGYTQDAEKYLRALWKYVSRAYQEQGGLDPIEATHWHRVSLTVLALGADPTCFGEDADGNPIDLIADGTYYWKTTDNLGLQGTNAWIYALLVLDAMDYELPEDALYTREEIVRQILVCQTPEGGFHVGSGEADVDMTAMTLHALAPYVQTDTEVAQSVERALDYISQAQNAQGDFGGGSESCAQVILALCALGIDPAEDERFCKMGGSVLDGLLMYHVNDGGFSHLLGDEANTLSTVQAAQALTALERLRQGQGRLYDFTDQTIAPFTPGTGVPIILCFAALITGGAIIIVLIGKGKKKCTM